MTDSEETPPARKRGGATGPTQHAYHLSLTRTLLHVYMIQCPTSVLLTLELSIERADGLCASFAPEHWLRNRLEKKKPEDSTFLLQACGDSTSYMHVRLTPRKSIHQKVEWGPC